MPIARRSWLSPLVVSLMLAGCQSTPATPTVPPPTSTGSHSGAPAAGMPSGPAAPGADAPATSGDGASAPLTTGGDTAPDATVDPTTTLPDATGTSPVQAVPGAQGANIDRTFVDGMIQEIQADLTLLDDAAAKAQHDEIKAYVAKAKPRLDAQLTQLKQWRKDWFGVDTPATTAGVNTDMFPSGGDYDWSWADEMTRRMQNGLELAKATASGQARADVKTMAQAVLKDWTADRDQLNGWADTWLAAMPPADDPYAGVDLTP